MFVNCVVGTVFIIMHRTEVSPMPIPAIWNPTTPFISSCFVIKRFRNCLKATSQRTAKLSSETFKHMLLLKRRFQWISVECESHTNYVLWMSEEEKSQFLEFREWSPVRQWDMHMKEHESYKNAYEKTFSEIVKVIQKRMNRKINGAVLAKNYNAQNFSRSLCDSNIMAS